ncbi:MAG TPA: 3'-5' exonuclease [Candidatus Hydrogenedentes bacterium]|nr:3'-5' exonuclease [Candidatus Hydrogenedentota bacterium]
MEHALVAPETMVAVSLETTGLNPLQDRITEVGAVRFDYEGALLDTFWERANPGMPIPEHIRKITGVTDEKVANARPPEEVVRDFFVWTGPAAWLVAHSGEFEAAFLYGALGERDDADEDRCVLSTLRWARWAELGMPNYRLPTLLQYIGAERRTGPSRNVIVKAQGVVDLMVFLLTRSYADPSHTSVKNILVFRTDLMRDLHGRVTAEWERRMRPQASVAACSLSGHRGTTRAAWTPSF